MPVRAIDLVARVGADEFFVLTSGIPTFRPLGIYGGKDQGFYSISAI